MAEVNDVLFIVVGILKSQSNSFDPIYQLIHLCEVTLFFKIIWHKPVFDFVFLIVTF